MENRDLKNQAYTQIKNKLLSCEYPPSAILNEAMIAEGLGFSRTPIREALTRIEYEGFVSIIPKKGILVNPVSLNTVKQLFEVRAEIEPITLRMAAPVLQEKELLEYREQFVGEPLDVSVGYLADTAMHLFIIDQCGNDFLIDMMHKVFERNTQIIIYTKQNVVSIHDARLEHLEIIDLLLEQNYEKAQESMRSHIESCKNAALDYFYNMRPTAGAPYQPL